jgi:hypothetical protein
MAMGSDLALANGPYWASSQEEARMRRRQIPRTYALVLLVSAVALVALAAGNVVSDATPGRIAFYSDRDGNGDGACPAVPDS